jgi:hypothetical protein
MYMNLTLAVVISVIFTILKMAIHYKESPRPNLKDSVIVFVSSVAGLYALEQFGKVTPKVTEVFTETPAF